MPKPLTPDALIAKVRAIVKASTYAGAAADLGVSVTTIQNALRGKPPGDKLLSALGLRRGYVNGKGQAIAADALRRIAYLQVDGKGGYAKAGKALKISAAQIHTFVKGDDEPQPRMLEALGYTTVYLPK